MLPTLPELSMLPRDLLMLSQRLMLLSSTELTDMPMADMDTHMPMELTTERDLLMLSQRLMLMLLSSMELTDMVDMVLDMPVTDMLDTHMPLDMLMVVTHMPMELTTERDPLMLSQRLMLLTCMELMDMVDMVLDMPDMDMDTHMPMVDMDTHMLMESKLLQRLLSYCRQKLNSNLSFSIQIWIGLFVHLLFCSLKLTKNKY